MTRYQRIAAERAARHLARENAMERDRKASAKRIRAQERAAKERRRSSFEGSGFDYGMNH